MGKYAVRVGPTKGRDKTEAEARKVATANNKGLKMKIALLMCFKVIKLAQENHFELVGQLA